MGAGAARMVRKAVQGGVGVGSGEDLREGERARVQVHARKGGVREVRGGGEGARQCMECRADAGGPMQRECTCRCAVPYKARGRSAVVHGRCASVIRDAGPRT